MSTMEGADDDYLIDSDDSDDGNARDADPRTPQNVPKIVTIEDLEALKSDTLNILDRSWKTSRNKRLIAKMLELDEPTITAQMVDFLVQADACEVLIGYITQNGEVGKRPSPVDPHSDELKLAYKTMMLITSDEPSDGLIDFLSKRASMVTRLIFRIFEDSSAGSFFHVYRVCELFARYYPTDVFDALCSDGRMTERMTMMLRYIGYAPVTELIVMIIGLGPISRSSPLYSACEPGRTKFMRQLLDWQLFKRIAEIVISPEDKCYTGAYVDAESHSLYAAQLFQECVEKLSLEDIGEQLLRQLSDTSELIDMLANAVQDQTLHEYKRQNAAKILYFLLRRAADPEIACMMGGAQGGMMQPAQIQNRLFPLRENIVLHVGKHLPNLIHTLLLYSPVQAKNLSTAAKLNPIPESPLRFNTYEVPEPFTTMRLSFLELIVIMVESDEKMGNHLTSDLWRLLFKWCVIYAHNTIFHSLFYRLVFAILRQNQQHQRCLFVQSNFLNFLIETYLDVPFQLDDAGNLASSGGSEHLHPPRNAAGIVKNRFVARCLIMNCAHAVRLQAASQPPQSFISTYLNTNSSWTEFLPILVAATELQHRFGMGIQVTDFKPSHNVNSLMGLMSDSQPQIDEDGGINLGSTFAKNLGFYDECSWSDSLENDASIHTLNTSDVPDSPDRGERLSGDGRDTSRASLHGAFLSPAGRGSLSGPTLFFDKDNQEDADIIDGITSPIDAMETLEKRKSLVGEESPFRKSLQEPKMSPHEIKQLFALDAMEEVQEESVVHEELGISPANSFSTEPESESVEIENVAAERK